MNSTLRRLAPGCSITAWCLLPAAALFAQAASLPERPVIGDVTTTRVIPGAPYSLAGARLVFTNWYYVQPGDLDWRNAEGKSVYVHGSEGPLGAQHVGINAPRGVRIRAERPHVVGGIDRPHRMIMREGDVYKGWTDSDYYESADAVHWERKARLELDGAVHDGLFHIFVDPVASSDQRYKAVWTGHITRADFDTFRKQRPGGWEPRALLVLGEQDSIACLRGSVSPDGIHWTTLPEPLVVEYSDTFNTAYYDPLLREYVLYTRYWSVGPRSENLPPDIRNSWTGIGRRAIGRTSSPDFSRFEPSEMMLEPPPDMLPSEQLYTNCYTTIPGGPDQHLMFPSIWNGSIDDTTRVALACSHDGRSWHWVPEGDVLETQPFGEWDGGCIWALPNLIELPGGDWGLPYMGHNFPHKYPRGQLQAGLGYAVWSKGRMVALEAEEEGEFTTISLIPRGKVLKINALTRRTGWIKVASLGSEGRSLEDCVPVVGDQHWAPIRWKAGEDLGIEPGQAVTLRVQMKQAKLFGLEFE